MNQLSDKRMTLLLGVVSGALGSAVLLWFFTPWGNPPAAETAQEASPQPLYWVAPMDADYRRDKPGKSPMGMDLVPVYADAPGAAQGAGTIKISPEVVNNLGVRTARVEKRALATQISTVGYVKYDEDRLIHVHPRVEGVDRKAVRKGRR